MDNNFSFNERLRKFPKHEKFLLFKPVTSLDYKEVLLKTLNTIYTPYQENVRFEQKKKNFQEKNCHNTIKILTAE